MWSRHHVTSCELFQDLVKMKVTEQSPQREVITYKYLWQLFKHHLKSVAFGHPVLVYVTAMLLNLE